MNETAVRLIIDGIRQKAFLQDPAHTFTISTAKNGAGCLEGSYCTPTGLFRIAEKIGDGTTIGTVFRSRQPTGAIWQGEDSNEDLILSRILWLEGIEPHNANTKSRYIYLHGTNHEKLLGTPASRGCIRFSNQDIITLFQTMAVGDVVEIIYPQSLA